MERKDREVVQIAIARRTFQAPPDSSLISFSSGDIIHILSKFYNKTQLGRNINTLQYGYFDTANFSTSSKTLTKQQSSNFYQLHHRSIKLIQRLIQWNNYFSISYTHVLKAVERSRFTSTHEFADLLEFYQFHSHLNEQIVFLAALNEKNAVEEPEFGMAKVFNNNMDDLMRASLKLGKNCCKYFKLVDENEEKNLYNFLIYAIEYQRDCYKLSSKAIELTESPEHAFQYHDDLPSLLKLHKNLKKLSQCMRIVRARENTPYIDELLTKYERGLVRSQFGGQEAYHVSQCVVYTKEGEMIWSWLYVLENLAAFVFSGSPLLKRGRYKSLHILPVDAEAASFLEKADRPAGYPRVKTKRTALLEYTVAGDSAANLLVEFRSVEERADFLLMENVIRKIQILPNLNVPHEKPTVFPSSKSEDNDGRNSYGRSGHKPSGKLEDFDKVRRDELKAELAKMERRKRDQCVAKLAEEWDNRLRKNVGETAKREVPKRLKVKPSLAEIEKSEQVLTKAERQELSRRYRNGSVASIVAEFNNDLLREKKKKKGTKSKLGRSESVTKAEESAVSARLTVDRHGNVDSGLMDVKRQLLKRESTPDNNNRESKTTQAPADQKKYSRQSRASQWSGNKKQPTPNNDNLQLKPPQWSASKKESTPANANGRSFKAINKELINYSSAGDYELAVRLADAEDRNQQWASKFEQLKARFEQLQALQDGNGHSDEASAQKGGGRGTSVPPPAPVFADVYNEKYQRRTSNPEKDASGNWRPIKGENFNGYPRNFGTLKPVLVEGTLCDPNLINDFKNFDRNSLKRVARRNLETDKKSDKNTDSANTTSASNSSKKASPKINVRTFWKNQMNEKSPKKRRPPKKSNRKTPHDDQVPVEAPVSVFGPKVNYKRNLSREPVSKKTEVDAAEELQKRKDDLKKVNRKLS